MYDFDHTKDYYAILWVAQTASPEEIKKAFRSAAMKHHPDKGGDAEEFKKINEAHQVIGNPTKKSQYDQIRSGWGNFGGFGGGSQYGGGFQNGQFGDVQFDFGWFGDLGDILDQFMGWGSRGTRPRKWEDVQLQLQIGFSDSFHGLTKNFSYARTFWEGSKGAQKSSQIEVKVPKGIQSGQYIKYTGMGDGGRNGGPEWDLYIQIVVTNDKKRTRKNDDIYTTIDVGIFDLVLWSSQKVDHPDGSVEFKIPKGTQPKDIIRVKGKWFGEGGIFGKSGDLMIVLHLVLPKKLSHEQERLWKQLSES